MKVPTTAEYYRHYDGMRVYVPKPAPTTIKAWLKMGVVAWFDAHDDAIMAWFDRIDRWMALDFGSHEECEREVVRLKGTIAELHRQRDDLRATLRGLALR